MSPPCVGADAAEENEDDGEGDLSDLSDEELLDLLPPPAVVGADANQGSEPPEKKAKGFGIRWDKPPPLVTGGRRQWSFGHKLYALIKLREVGGNKSKLVREVLPLFPSMVRSPIM